MEIRENVASCKSFNLIYERSSFMLNKTFTIPILPFKNYDFSLSFNFQLKPKIGSYPKKAVRP